MAFTGAIVPVDADGKKHAETDAHDHVADQVPVEWLWLFLRKSKRENFFMKLVLYAVFIALFTTMTLLVRPVKDTYTVHSTILAHTSDEAFPNANFEKTFHHIANDPDWWEWVETVLIPAVMSDEYFNGDSRAKTWGQRFMNTVSMYNTQTATLRFRQVRVTDDSCDTPAKNSELARPCWGDFNSDKQFKGTFGSEYGNKYLKGLNSLGGKEGFAPSGGYGDEAHIVDLALDKASALSTIAKMKQDLWLNEQTRAISIESNWYNANLDMSTYCRWHVDISPGGRYQPYVEILSCRLDPYSSGLDQFRAVLEVLFTLMLFYYIIVELYDIKQMPDKKAYFFSLWNLIELTNLVVYFLIMLFFFLYVIKDKSKFEKVSTAKYDDRPNLHDLANDFNFTSNIAAFNIVFAYLKIFKYLQMYPSLSQLWQTLEVAMTDIMPFLVVFVLFTSGFTFAAHWIFGFMMIEFHNWPRSFSTLMQTVTGGLPYDEMKQHAPIGAAVFTIAWIIMVVMVLMNMFVAILTEWQAQVTEQNEKEAKKLSRHVGKNANIGVFGGWFRYLYTKLSGKPMGNASMIYDYDDQSRDVCKMMKQADVRNTDKVRNAVLDGQQLTTADIVSHFGGDEAKAVEFTRKVKELMAASKTEGDDEGEEDQELREQQRLKVLQQTVERLEGQLKALRSALHTALVAPAQDGQSLDGYERRHATGVPALPGAIDS